MKTLMQIILKKTNTKLDVPAETVLVVEHKRCNFGMRLIQNIIAFNS